MTRAGIRLDGNTQQEAFIKTAWLPIIPAIACVSCAVAPVGPGDAPADEPPRLVKGSDGLIWDDPGAFGPVPPDLEAKGNARCRANELDHAIGYHPLAQNEDGETFDEGGFYCVNAD